MTSFTGVSSFPALLAMTLLLSLAARATADAAAVLRAAPLSGAECAAGGVWVASRGGSRGRGAARLKLMAAMILASFVKKFWGSSNLGPPKSNPKSLHFSKEQICSPSWFVGLGHGCCFVILLLPCWNMDEE